MHTNLLPEHPSGPPRDKEVMSGKSPYKPADERNRVIAGVEASGHGALAQLMRHLGSDKEPT